MEVDIEYRPSYSLAVVQLEPNEFIQVEAGSMVSMSPGITIETDVKGGLLGALKRSMLGGESFFMNDYRAPAQGGEITLAPALPGDLAVLDLKGDTLMVQSGSYVASSQGITVDTTWSGAKTFFASEGLIMLKCSGNGTLVVSSYGAIHEMELAAGETVTVDTGHLVAFDQGMGFEVRAVSGIKSTLFSGEGLVVDVTGPGKVLMQTRSDDAFLSWLIPRLPKSDKRG
ncbi:MAG: TIGR00266 family protein [Anaerolineae bacterium]|nr:TIGR00266 family protein [Anaerolineae bacterium]NIN97272.1 TIGR00266 family protein [Anaerolineae bacterium]NIQ80202.1 TIGR00266 family protein [Anaerolineae bacterium]